MVNKRTTSLLAGIVYYLSNSLYRLFRCFLHDMPRVVQAIEFLMLQPIQQLVKVEQMDRNFLFALLIRNFLFVIYLLTAILYCVYSWVREAIEEQNQCVHYYLRTTIYVLGCILATILFYHLNVYILLVSLNNRLMFCFYYIPYIFSKYFVYVPMIRSLINFPLNVLFEYSFSCYSNNINVSFLQSQTVCAR